MRTWTRLQKATVLATLAYASIFVFMLIVRPGSRQFYDAFFNTYQIFPPLLSGIIGLIYYRNGRHGNAVRRTGWLLIALSCLSFAVGQSTWTWLESVKGIQVPFPSWADAGYLGSYPLVIMGIILLFGSMPVAGRARQLLDSAMVAGSAGILSWVFVIQPLWNQSDVPLVGKIISVAYPLSDIASLFAALVLISSAKNSPILRRSLYFLFAGVVGFTFFDTSFTWMSLNGTYQTGSWSDWALSFGWIAIGYSFLARMWWLGEPLRTGQFPIAGSPNQKIRSMRQILAPYAAVSAACVIIVIRDYSQDGVLQNFSVAACAFLMALVMVRQVLALEENRILTEKLKSFNDNLEKLVGERTAELEIKNEEVLKLMEERNSFFRYVSHEFRTPLTSVIGFTECLFEDEDEPLTQNQKYQLLKVHSSAHRLLGMVDDLLDISKVEAGRMEVQKNGIDLDDMIEQIVDSVRPLAAEKALDISIEVSDDLPDLITDEQKLSHIILNLLSNAIKYTQEGTISISAYSVSDAVKISIRDTGIGIAEEELPNIFKEFYRVQSGTVQRGTGLGLTIVQKFTELLGGRVTVESKLYSGSTFTVTLPVSPENRRKYEKAADPVRPVCQ